MKFRRLCALIWFGIFPFFSMNGVMGQEGSLPDTASGNKWLAKGLQLTTSSDPGAQDSALMFFRRSFKVYEPFIDSQSPPYVWEGYLKARIHYLDVKTTSTQNDLAETEELAELSIRHLGKENEVVPLSLMLAARIHTLAENYEDAVDYSQQAIQLLQSGPKSEERTRQMLRGMIFLAKSFRRTGQRDSAVRYFEYVIEEEKNIGKKDIALTARHNLAILAREAGNLNEAIAIYEELLDALEGETSREKVYLRAAVFNNLGSVQSSRGDFVKALAAYRRAYDELSPIVSPSEPNHALLLLNLGVAYSKAGDAVKAKEYLEKSLEDTRGIWFRQKPTIITNLAEFYKREGEYDAALNLLSELRPVVEEKYGKDHPGTAKVYGQFGSVYLSMNRGDSARYFLSLQNQVYQANPRVSNYSRITNLIYLARSAFQLGDGQQAAELLDEAQRVALTDSVNTLKDQIPIANTRAYMYQKAGNIEKAIAQHKRSLDILNHIPGQHLPENVSRKIPVLSKTAELVSQSNPSPEDLEYADSLYEEAISLASQVQYSFTREASRLSHKAKYADLYPKAAQLSMAISEKTSDPAYLEKAFGRVEKGKATLLAQAIRQAGAHVFSGLPPEMIERERQLKIDLAYYEKAIFEESRKEGGGSANSLKEWKDKRFALLREQEMLQLFIKFNYPAYLQYKSGDSVATVARIQESLPENTGLLEFAIADSQVLAFLITRDDFVVKSLPNVTAAEVDSLRWGLHGYQTEVFPNKSQQWYDKLYRKMGHHMNQRLLDPFESLLPENLVIVTDAHLGYIPFETLLTSKPEATLSYKDYPFLLKQKQISYAYSATLYHFGQARQPSYPDQKSLLAVAPAFEPETGPQFTAASLRRDPFDPLLYNTREASYIADLLGGISFQGPRASKEEFIQNAPAHRIIHIASHAVVDNQYPNYSFIAFSQPEDSTQQDPLLYLSEIYNLQLNAELVVLSACNTGIGAIHKGEGIASLARGFTYAGARSLVTTLWSVNDKYTAELMQVFYQHLKAGKSKDQALREAKLALLEDYNLSPFYWAAPVAIGDMRPISTSRSPVWMLIGGILLLFCLLGWKLKKNRNKKMQIG